MGHMQEYKNIKIRKAVNNEERIIWKDLHEDVKLKNEARSDEERKKFYWKVVDMKIKK